MRRLNVGIAISVSLMATFLAAYEWTSHNRMAWNARDSLTNDSRAILSIGSELKTFLQTYGDDLDTRAGKRSNDNYTDEDHCEGYFRAQREACAYREEACSQLGSLLGRKVGTATCTFDHFLPKLTLPLGQEEATRHARYYVDLAVKLYKAAKCDDQGKAALYYRWAARALGHAIHLVEDMGSPQHTIPENHLDFPFGHGKSFHEYWALDVWGLNAKRLYNKPDGTGSVQVGGFEEAAQDAYVPRTGKLEGIMGSMAAESRGFLGGSPYQPGAPGSSLLLTELQRVFSDSELQLNLRETIDGEGNPNGWTLPRFSIRSFPIYGRGLADDNRHTYGTFTLLARADYDEVGGSLPIQQGQISVKSFELAERLWAQVDAEHFDYPVRFDESFHTLITHTTEAAAGAILAFWDEVNGYSCPCYGFSPCAFREATKAAGAGFP
jgi:hypothetical protein